MIMSTYGYTFNKNGERTSPIASMDIIMLAASRTGDEVRHLTQDEWLEDDYPNLLEDE